MGTSTISQLAAAGSLAGTELVEVSQLSASVTISAGTISAVASDNSFNDSGSGFVAAGFAVGDRVKVAGFTGNAANNIVTGKITALTAGKMTIGGMDGDVIVDDAAGETVTITKWVSRRTTVADLIAGLATMAQLTAEVAKIASRKVRAASTANVTLASGVENGDSIDGVTLATGDRVLLKNQSSGAENGIWIVAASGAPTRATDADSSDELVNISVWVSEGTANADTLWTCTTNAPITVNTTALTFTSITIGGVIYASTTEQLTGTETSKSSNPDSIAALWEQGSDVASAATVSLGEGGYFNITGTTTITDIDFATDRAGRKAWVKFAAVLTLTHNASTLILPGGASITTAAGDTACFVSEGSDVVRCVAYQKANGQAVSGGAGYSGGVQSTPVLAAAMTSRTTNGPSTGSTETATNKVMLATLDFDASTIEYAQFMFPDAEGVEREHDNGTVYLDRRERIGDVIWGIQGVAFSDDDALDAAFGTAQTVTDTLLSASDQHTTSFTSAVTIAGTPAEGDLVCFQVYRNASSGSDTLAADAKLIGIRLNFTTNAADDS